MDMRRWREHTDFLRVVLNTIVFVSGAIGSMVNMAKGNNIPLALSIAAMVIVVVFVAVELLTRGDQRPQTIPRPATPVSAGPAAPPETGAAVRPVPVTPPGAAEALWYRTGDGRRVIRLVTPAARNGVRNDA